jgi:hypothetical protein
MGNVTPSHRSSSTNLLRYVFVFLPLLFPLLTFDPVMTSILLFPRDTFLATCRSPSECPLPIQSSHSFGPVNHLPAVNLHTQNWCLLRSLTSPLHDALLRGTEIPREHSIDQKHLTPSTGCDHIYSYLKENIMLFSCDLCGAAISFHRLRNVASSCRPILDGYTSRDLTSRELFVLIVCWRDSTH